MSTNVTSLHKFLPWDYVTDTLNAKQAGDYLQDVQSRINDAAAMSTRKLIRMGTELKYHLDICRTVNKLITGCTD
jgi:hypothetical protein